MPYIGKSPTGSGVRQRFHFTATGGETSLSGADDNSKTLKFTDGEFLDVYLNGVLLVQGTDYGVGTTNTINSLSALSAGDIVEIVAYDIFNVAKINSEAIRARHYFTASGSETSIGTSQIAGLSFAANADIDVSINGVTLVAGSDYNTTTANTVGGLSALTAGQVVEIVIYEKFQLADTVSKASGGTFNGPVTFNGQVTFSGDVVGAVQEYFEVNLTSDITGIADTTSTVVDFGGSGAVVYDTASNFDSSNDAYLLGSSDGVYLISFCIGIRSNNLGNSSGDIIAAMSGIEIATDGTTFVGYKAASESLRHSDVDNAQTALHQASFIYKATTATTKIRLTAICEMTGSDTWRIASTGAGMFQTSVTSNLNTARVTFMSVMRIK